MTRRTKNYKESAVSPVIGVMLMLVVTIIIAAVVSGFAGGLAGKEKAAPSLSMDVQADSSTGKITFSHLGGDTVNTKDLEISAYYTNAAGKEYHNSTTKSSALTEVYPAGSWNGTSWDAGITRVPFLNNMQRTTGCTNESAWFGNYTFGMGDVMSSYSNAGTSSIIGCDASTAANFSTGDVVDLKIKHIPSGKLIYDKEVQVR